MRKSSTITLGLTLVVAAASMAGAQQAAPGVARDKNGKIARSAKAKDEFKRETGFPKGRPGYVIDHVVPLANGGRDAPSNMQWQTKAEAKAKDRYERGGFGKTAKSKSATGHHSGSHSHGGHGHGGS
jgi:hypothetical protein